MKRERRLKESCLGDLRWLGTLGEDASMEIWLWILTVILFGIVIFLGGKVHFLRRSAREIHSSLGEKLSEDTNTLLDLSSRDSAMRELAAGLNEELRMLREERQRYQQGDLELKEAVTNLSHDLRTPLTAIRGYLELMKREKLSGKAAEYLAIIEERTQAMGDLTGELLRYSAAKSAIREIPREEICLNDVLEDSIAAYYGVITQCDITPEIAIAEEKVWRNLNRNALSRIFGNILSNAAKYSDGDLKINLTEQGEITFLNHASNLDELKTRQLFGKFYTVDSAQASTGLGLSIAKLLTGELGGEISAEYEEGVLCIRVRFPKTD